MIFRSCSTLRTLNDGNKGLFLTMGNAGFRPSAVFPTGRNVMMLLEGQTYHGVVTLAGPLKRRRVAWEFESLDVRSCFKS